MTKSPWCGDAFDQTVLLDCKAEYKIYMYMLRADLRKRFACASASHARSLFACLRGGCWCSTTAWGMTLVCDECVMSV